MVRVFRPAGQSRGTIKTRYQPDVLWFSPRPQSQTLLSHYQDVASSPSDLITFYAIGKLFLGYSSGLGFGFLISQHTHKSTMGKENEKNKEGINNSQT